MREEQHEPSAISSQQSAPSQPLREKEGTRDEGQEERGSSRFRGWDILSAGQFSPADLDHLFKVADEMAGIVRRHQRCSLLDRHVVATLFYEPSTRTRLSFESAVVHLGGKVISTSEVTFSSVVKGESLPDTVRVIERYSDAIVLRHTHAGAAAEAAAYASVPIFNAGDGPGEHPTQALLDLYTIREEKGGQIDGLRVGMVGDLKYGRTVHSLARLLCNYDVGFTFVAPDALRMPLSVIRELNRYARRYQETEDLHDVIAESDVLYVTRIQKERLEQPELWDYVKDLYTVDPALMAQAKPDMTLMHPLPRLAEISPEVDGDPRAAYFRQVGNGLFVRMALLSEVLRD